MQSMCCFKTFSSKELIQTHRQEMSKNNFLATEDLWEKTTSLALSTWEVVSLKKKQFRVSSLHPHVLTGKKKYHKYKSRRKKKSTEG